MSVTYGISEAEVRTLRTGKGGLLKVTNDERTSHQEYPLIISGPICPFGGVHRKPLGDCFIAGTFLAKNLFDHCQRHFLKFIFEAKFASISQFAIF